MFYTFSQNNSGGWFEINETVSLHVIIEADSAEEANTLATMNDIYFDGCSYGKDCACCGDRWYEQYADDDGEKKPMIYGQDVFNYKHKSFHIDWNKEKKFPDVYIYYKDGTVKKVNL